MSETQEPESHSNPPDSARTNEKEDDTLTVVSQLDEGQTSKRKGRSTTAAENDKRKEFFKEELKRLQRSLEKESEKIKPPPVQEHVPYCFNALEPYYNTSTAIHVIEKTGDDGKMIGKENVYAVRNTAIGLVDPWVSHSMDAQAGPLVAVKERAPFRETPKKEKRVGEGSTMIPAFPVIKLDTPDLESRKLNYNDVPALRKELKEKYSSQGKSKKEEDYKRTKNDFYRMELHKLTDVHPMNRGNMKAAYFAYLQNSPGSKQAVYECVKQVEGKEDEKNEEAEGEEQGKGEEEPTTDETEAAEHHGEADETTDE